VPANRNLEAATWDANAGEGAGDEFVEHFNSGTIGCPGWLRFNREGSHK